MAMLRFQLHLQAIGGPSSFAETARVPPYPTVWSNMPSKASALVQTKKAVARLPQRLAIARSPIMKWVFTCMAIPVIRPEVRSQLMPLCATIIFTPIWIMGCEFKLAVVMALPKTCPSSKTIGLKITAWVSFYGPTLGGPAMWITIRQ